MSYRNDYDAACARLEVLESEHAKLVAENARLRGQMTSPVALTPPPPTPPVPTEPAFSLGVLACMCAFGSLALAFIAIAVAA
ncbi:MAG TPA: hypothetical protein VL326_32400 [Kofleriaceae bacterium]|nr:hypothetical protein [Kofleriaceae bacterium]